MAALRSLPLVNNLEVQGPAGHFPCELGLQSRAAWVPKPGCLVLTLGSYLGKILHLTVPQLRIHLFIYLRVYLGQAAGEGEKKS